MVNIVHTALLELPAGQGRRALVMEDKGGRHDSGRHVSHDAAGATFFWSETSLQADLESTIEAAKWWAEKHKADTVYICR